MDRYYTNYQLNSGNHKKIFFNSETIIYENNLDQQIKINYQNELSKFLRERKIVDPKILSFLSEIKNGNHPGKVNERKVN